MLRHHSCLSHHPSLIMLPKKAALYPPEDELVSLSTLYELLDEQQHRYKELIQQQERNYRAFLQMLMDTSSSRMDGLVREMQDLRSCLQRARAELAEVKKQGVQNGKRAECLAEGLVTVRGALDGLAFKSGRTEGDAGGRAVDLKQRRGGSGLRLDGGGRAAGGRDAKKPEPKAVKLVADLTDIHFDDIKVVHTHAFKMNGPTGLFSIVWQCTASCVVAAPSADHFESMCRDSWSHRKCFWVQMSEATNACSNQVFVFVF